MADSTTFGTPWTDAELDLIVDDYFAMRAMEQAGVRYVKSHHAAALMDRIGRSHRSVEFKHMNISAVLDELGMDIIRGYRPAPNYQQAIFPAIDRYLMAHPDAWDQTPAPKPFVAATGVADPPLVFVEPPPLQRRDKAVRPAGLERLIRKFDPVERDHRNRKLGREGEAFVVDFERARLAREGRKDLADDVRWVADLEGDGHGYDILSFTPEGEQRLIEVKTTCGGQTTPFFLSRNEMRVSEERAETYRLYRVFDFARKPRLFELPPPLNESVVLETEVWRAGFG